MEKNAYVAVGDAGPVTAVAEMFPEQAIVEVYFNLKSEGAVALMQAVTEQINCQFLPFALKTPYAPEHYSYCDAVVLRLFRQDHLILEDNLQRIYADFQPYLRPQTPFFTRTLAPGVGMVEPPHQPLTSQEDFGLHCCHIIALGLLEACRRQTRSAEARMAAILQLITTKLGVIRWPQPPAKTGQDSLRISLPNLDR
jgi:HopA1 effector protein family